MEFYRTYPTASMKALIIEDEYPAAERLTKMIQKTDSSIEVLEVLESIEAAKRWFSSHEAPDLIFSDIQLSDGLSFVIFDEIPITSPIIFTTSYDEYAIKAFKVKSIDYLLKPIKPQELNAAIEKYRALTGAKATKTTASKFSLYLIFFRRLAESTKTVFGQTTRAICPYSPTRNRLFFYGQRNGLLDLQ